jgi:aminopeptidase N
VNDAQHKEEILDNIQLCTTFEPALARTLLPCFDEPYFKAVFQMKVYVKNKKHIAISNTEC